MRLVRVGLVLTHPSIFFPQPPDMLLLISSNDLLALQKTSRRTEIDRSSINKRLSRDDLPFPACAPPVR